MKENTYKDILPAMQKMQLNFTRAQFAKKPSREEIQAKIAEANEKYNRGAGRIFLPEIYTR